MNVKNVIQAEALEAWLKKKKGTVLMGTGLGKTRLGVMASKTHEGKTIVVTSRLPLVKQ
jgi:superfamily II DNA or RNA helicase